MIHRLLSSILLLLFLAPASRAEIDTLWARTVEGEGATTLRDVAPLADGGFVVVGHTRINFSHEDFFAARVDEDGFALWENTYHNGTSDDQLEGVVALPNGDFIAVGHTDAEQALVIFCFDSEGDSLWTRTYNPDKLCSGRDIILLSDGNLAVIGFRLGAGGEHSDVWLMKCNTSGDSLWARTFGGNGTDTGSSLIERADGTFQLCGSSADSNQESNFWTLRVDASGSAIGTALEFGTAAEERAWDVFVNNDGNTFLCGSQETGGGHHGFVAMDPAEGQGWTETYEDDGIEEQFRSIVPRLGGALCVGWAGNSPNRNRPLIVEINGDGTNVDDWTYGVAEIGSGLYSIERVPAGGAVAVGTHIIGSTRCGLIIRIASTGGVSGVVRDIVSGDPVPGVRVSAMGQTDYAFTDLAGVYSLELVSGTYDIVASGYCIDSALVQQIVVEQAAVTEVDLSVGVPDIEPAQTSVNMFARNHLLAVGYYRLHNHGSGQFYFSVVPQAIAPPGNWIYVDPPSGALAAGEQIAIEVRVEADTTEEGVWDYLAELQVHSNACPDTLRTIPVLITVLDGEEPAAAAPTSFAFHPAFPNPFNAETRLSFDLPEPAQVTLELFNIAGQSVRLLADEPYTSGSYAIDVSLTDLPSGVYLARLQAGSFTASRKLILLR